MRTSAFTAAKCCLAVGCLAAAAMMTAPAPPASARFVAAHELRRSASPTSPGRQETRLAGRTGGTDADSPRLRDILAPADTRAPRVTPPAPPHRLAAGEGARAPLSGFDAPPAPPVSPAEPEVTFRVVEDDPLAGLVPEPTPDPVPQPDPALLAEVRSLREEVLRIAQAKEQPPAPSDELRRLTEELRNTERFRRLEDELRALRSDGPENRPSPSTEAQTAAPSLPPPPPPTSFVRAIPSETGDDRYTLQVESADVVQVLDMLGQMAGWNVVAGPGISGTVTLNLHGVTVEQALDAILTPRKFVAEKRDGLLFVLTAADAAAARVNRTGASASRLLVTKIYRPNYIPVRDLHSLIKPLLTFENSYSLTRSTEQTQQGAGASVGAVIPSGAGGTVIGQANGVSGQTSSTTKSQFTADEKTGIVEDLPQGDALVVQDYPDVIEEIDKILLEVDVPPMQVVIEAVILRVTLDDSMRLGVNLAMLRNSEQDRIVTGAAGGAAALTPLSATLGNVAGLRYGFLHGDVSGFIEALEEIAETSLVASPSLRVLNRQEAELIIGKELGYKTQTFLNQQTIESVQFLPVGTKLAIRPYAAPDGLIRMDVHPEKSSGFVDGNGIPQTDTTSVTTNVMVRDGSTVVIGGLIDEQTEESLSQVPVLGSIPWVGAAFRNSTEKLTRSELIVLITPRIVCDPIEEARGDVIRAESEQRAAYFSNNLSPVSRRNLGRMHVERAAELYSKGRLAEAHDHVREALAIRKNDGEALRLKNMIEQALAARRKRMLWFPTERLQTPPDVPLPAPARTGGPPAPGPEIPAPARSPAVPDPPPPEAADPPAEADSPFR